MAMRCTLLSLALRFVTRVVAAGRFDGCRHMVSCLTAGCCGSVSRRRRREGDDMTSRGHHASSNDAGLFPQAAGSLHTGPTLSDRMCVCGPRQTQKSMPSHVLLLAVCRSRCVGLHVLAHISLKLNIRSCAFAFEVACSSCEGWQLLLSGWLRPNRTYPKRWHAVNKHMRLSRLRST